MKRLLLPLLFAAQSCFAQWVEGSTIGVRADNSKAPIAMFVNSYTGYGPQAGKWFRVSVKDLGIPEDAISVFLSGILIITHGFSTQICDLHVSVRAPGNDLDPGNYIGQSVETAIGSAQRSNMSTWAPVVNGEIELWWWKNTIGNWPDECAYGVSLSAQAYVR